MRTTDKHITSDMLTVIRKSTIMASFVAIVFQVGTEVRASVVTRSVATDDNGNDIIVAGHSNMAVSTSTGTDTASLFKALSKIPAAKHIAAGHTAAESAAYLPAGSTGINILFGVSKAEAVKPTAKK